MIRHLLPAAVLASGVLAAASAAPQDNPVRPDPPAEKTNPYEGTYAVVSGEEDGKPIPPERVEGALVKITKDTISGTDKNGQEFFAANYTVDATDTPPRMKLRQKGAKESAAVFALAELKEPNLKIVYNLPGGPLPKEFKTVKGQHMFVLKRQVKDGVPAAEKK